MLRTLRWIWKGSGPVSDLRPTGRILSLNRHNSHRPPSLSLSLSLSLAFVFNTNSFHSPTLQPPSPRTPGIIGVFIGTMRLKCNRTHCIHPLFKHKPSFCPWYLTFPMLRLQSSKAKGRKHFWKPSKPCHVGIHWKALVEHYQMSTNVTGFQSFFQLFFKWLCFVQISHQQHWA